MQIKWYFYLRETTKLASCRPTQFTYTFLYIDRVKAIRPYLPLNIMVGSPGGVSEEPVT